MLLINQTVSLCDHCYRHIPAVVYESAGKILMKKRCPTHGELDSVVEVDPEFYYSLEHQIDIPSFNKVLFEVTDRCQLACPHCYHLPDNKTSDIAADAVLGQINSFPRDCVPMFAGAEPTLRSDFVDLCTRSSRLGFQYISVLSNGVRFADRDFTHQCFDAGLRHLCFGLNHASYQGSKIHDKQLHALDNLIDTGYDLGYVGYTIETLDHVEDILEEIQRRHDPCTDHYRIRCGSFIGRSLDKHRSYLSNLVKKVQAILGTQCQRGIYDDNPYHVMLDWGDIKLRLIQWPDVTNIDLDELATGPWCNFVPGPITNFVHQVIVRDAVKNLKLPMLDHAPKKYRYRRIEKFNHDHWRHGWPGTVQLDDFDNIFQVQPADISDQ